MAYHSLPTALVLYCFYYTCVKTASKFDSIFLMQARPHPITVEWAHRVISAQPKSKFSLAEVTDLCWSEGRCSMFFWAWIFPFVMPHGVIKSHPCRVFTFFPVCVRGTFHRSENCCSASKKEMSRPRYILAIAIDSSCSNEMAGSSFEKMPCKALISADQSG